MKATGNKLEEKLIGFAYEFHNEGRRRMVDIFPSSLAFHWEPRTRYPFAGASENESVGHFVQEILGISGQREQRWGPF